MVRFDIVIPSLKSTMIAYDGEAPCSGLVQALTKRGYEVVSINARGEALLQTLRSVKPQLLLLPLKSPFAERLEVIRQVLLLRTTAVVLLMEEWDVLLAKQAMESGSAGYLLKPFDTPQMSATLESAWHHFQKFTALQDNLELRKWLQKAKGILMDEKSISEDQAHQLILKMSQNQSLPLKEICLSIVQSKTGNEKPDKT